MAIEHNAIGRLLGVAWRRSTQCISCEGLHGGGKGRGSKCSELKKHRETRHQELGQGRRGTKPQNPRSITATIRARHRLPSTDTDLEAENYQHGEWRGNR
ncbi:unnamed protein product [Linum trigynum]|uniref:Uncharacterized protein n=1 Tax=Linum trigynum TaxID=586398 RepID=A0AAV2CIH8_9ROSI